MLSDCTRDKLKECREKMDYYNLFIKLVVFGFVLSLAGWALRNYIAERTKPAEKIDPKEVFVTVGTMEVHCKEKREDYEKMQAKNLEHAVELIDQNLKHGEKKFEKFEKTIDGLIKTVSAMGTSFVHLNEEIKKANSK